jgi:hypothetical protein
MPTLFPSMDLCLAHPAVQPLKEQVGTAPAARVSDLLSSSPIIRWTSGMSLLSGRGGIWRRIKPDLGAPRWPSPVRGLKLLRHEQPQHRGRRHGGHQRHDHHHGKERGRDDPEVQPDVEDNQFHIRIEDPRTDQRV